MGRMEGRARGICRAKPSTIDAGSDELLVYQAEKCPCGRGDAALKVGGQVLGASRGKSDTVDAWHGAGCMVGCEIYKLHGRAIF